MKFKVRWASGRWDREDDGYRLTVQIDTLAELKRFASDNVKSPLHDREMSLIVGFARNDPETEGRITIYDGRVE